MKKFLDTLITSKEIKSSKILHDFLTIENEFEIFKSKYSTRVPIVISEFENIEGIINMKITPDDELSAQKIKSSIENSEATLKKLNTHFKSLNVQLENVGNKLKEISSCFNQLYQNSEMSLDQPEVINSYRMLTNLTNNWANCYPKQINTINLELREFFNYLRKETTTFKEVIYLFFTQ